MSEKIIIADYIYTPDGYVEGQAMVFDESIIEIGVPEELTVKHPDAEIIRAKPHTVIYPGFINTHVHLEFSANRTSLTYGDFMHWLDSVIEHRDELVQQCDDAMMEEATNEMLRSGITSFGAISSFGTELEVCKRIPQRVTFYNELIGSSAAAADMLYGDFLERLNNSLHTSSDDLITPAIAIHAPYSVHPVLLSKAVSLAKEKNLPLSTHFLESSHEREWLESHSGGFLGFFQKFFNADRAITSIEEFMSAFDNYPTLFVHCTQTTSYEREYLAQLGHSIAHCPRSNRLLDCGRLPIEEITAPLSIATDGLSSNWSLNIWDELRAALMLHYSKPLNDMAEHLIQAITSDAAVAMRSDTGQLKAKMPADIAIITLPNRVSDTRNIALQTILHTNEVSSLYIQGRRII
jgi:cytosine/adenosine deaminase-related metal-dependent hydrolase